MSTERTLVLAVVGLLVPLVLTPVSATDPQSIDAAVAEVRAMRERGASNDEIARYVTRLVDRRMVNGNSLEGVGYREWPPLGYYYESRAWQTHDRYARERESNAATGPVRGRDYEYRARWAWNLGYGECGEASAMAYFILHGAGVPARMMEVPGHDFTVMGLAPNADPNDPRTWGPGARVVDGWQGSSYTAEEARTNRYIGRGGRRIDDVTGGSDNPALFEAELRNRGRANLNVHVVRTDGGGVGGVAVSLEGPEPRSTMSATDGTAVFAMVLDGAYRIHARPGVASGVRETSGSADVRRLAVGAPVEVTITMADEPVEPSDLIVRVYDAQGQPAGGAVVTSSQGGGGTTSDEGMTTMRAMPGVVQVTATKPGTGTGSLQLEVVRYYAAYANVILQRGDVVLAIGAPADSTTVRSSQLAVSGTVRGEGITTVSVAMDGAAVDVPVAEGAFAAGFTLTPGSHTFVASVPGARSDPVHVTYEPPSADTPPPDDPWVGRWRGPGRGTCNADGHEASQASTMELTVVRLSPAAVQLTSPATPDHPMTLALTPSNPLAGSAHDERDGPVIMGSRGHAVTDTAVFVREGRLYFTQRIVSRATATFAGHTSTSIETCETMAMLDPVR